MNIVILSSDVKISILGLIIAMILIMKIKYFCRSWRRVILGMVVPMPKAPDPGGLIRFCLAQDFNP